MKSLSLTFFFLLITTLGMAQDEPVLTLNLVKGTTLLVEFEYAGTEPKITVDMLASFTRGGTYNYTPKKAKGSIGKVKNKSGKHTIEWQILKETGVFEYDDLAVKLEINGKPFAEALLYPLAEGEDVYVGVEYAPDELAKHKDIKQFYRQLEYPVLARQANITGTVMLQFIVHEDGTPSHIKVLKTPHVIFNDSAKKAVMLSTFIPGTKDGKPVKTMLTQQVHFGISR